MRAAIVPLTVLLACAAAPVQAGSASLLDDRSVAGGSRYDRCLTLSKADPGAAERAAQSWHQQGGGAAALHCEALALVTLRRYSEAAAKLDQAAVAAATEAADVRVALFDQAGNAWLLASQPQRAESSIDSALALAPRDEDILFDRARARAGQKNWTGAEADLTALLAMDPDRADAFVLRASARHAQGRKQEASADIARALQVYPDYPEALVERGAMEYESGDAAGARTDWTLAARNSPDSDAGAAARAHLSELDAAAAKPRGK